MKKAIRVTIETVLIMYVMMWILCIETANAEMWIVAFGCLLTLLMMERWREVAGFIVETFNL
jgi:hypothetical protein